MPGGFLDPTFANGQIDSQYQASELLDDTILNPPRWAYRRRSVRSTYDPYRWPSLWPSPGFMSGDPTSPMSSGDDYAFGGGRLSYEMPSAGIQGTQTTKFIRGSCLDSASAAVADATLDAFITSTDVKDGAGTSFADGTYAVGVQTAGVSHYVVAYKAGSPDIAGTTVNTLVPTNIDGT